TRGFFGRLSQVLRPMITGLPMVTARKLARSVLSRQGRPPSLPMTPFLARAMGPAVRGIGAALASVLAGFRREDRRRRGPGQAVAEVDGRLLDEIEGRRRQQ